MTMSTNLITIFRRINGNGTSLQNWSCIHNFALTSIYFRACVSWKNFLDSNTITIFDLDRKWIFLLTQWKKSSPDEDHGFSLSRGGGES